MLMSISKSKNLERKLNNIAQEATNELNNVCGSSLWESLGFVFFDQLEDPEKIAKANNINAIIKHQPNQHTNERQTLNRRHKYR